MSNTSEPLPTTKLQLTKYEGDVQASISKRHPLHELLTPKSAVRFAPEIHGKGDATTLGFHITFGGGVDMSNPQARRTKYLASNDQHILIWPRDLARALNLPAHAEQNDTQVRILPGTGTDQFRIRFEPGLELRHLNRRIPQTTDGDTVVKHLTANNRTGDNDSQNSPEKYRLRFPNEYNDRYEFVEGDPVGVAVGEQENELAIILTPKSEEAPLTRTLQYEQLQAQSSAGNVSTTDQFSLNIPKVLVHFVLNGERKIELHPDEGEIEIWGKEAADKLHCR